MKHLIVDHLNKLDKKKDLKEMGKKFEEELMILILRDQEFAAQALEVVEPGTFSLEKLRIICRSLVSLRLEYGTHPDADQVQLRAIEPLKRAFPERIKEINAFFESINREIGNEEFVRDNALKFAKREKMKAVLLKTVDMISGPRPEDADHGLIAKMVGEVASLGYNAAETHNYARDFEERYKKTFRECLVPTGWNEINRITKGGLSAGQMGVIMAPTGTGKSQLLCHIGAAALKAGHKVLHVTLELPGSIIGRRYDAMLTQLPIDELELNKPLVKEVVDSMPGSLEILKYTRGTVTCSGLAARIDKFVLRGWKPDLIIVDYGDLLKAEGLHSRNDVALQSVFEGMVALGEQFNCPVWTASQTNRSGIKAHINELDNISDSFAKTFCANLILTLSRRPEDIQNSAGRLFVAKNNLGPDKQTFSLQFETYSKTFIEVVEEEGLQVPNMKDQNSKLQTIFDRTQTKLRDA
jgi:replicative DNA helicase